MRISVDSDDCGYENFRKLVDCGIKIEVYLNGEKVSHCVMVDEEEGIIIRCVLDDKGVPQLDPEDSDSVWCEEVTGEVKIVLIGSGEGK